MPESVQLLATSSSAPSNGDEGDSHHCEPDGLDESERARKIFLTGCDLPAAWGGQAQWRVLETCFGLGLNFLVTWAAWKLDPLRPKMLHFVSISDCHVSAEDVPGHTTKNDINLRPLALQLQAQLWGLTPGFHRLVFENGHVLLTLCVGQINSVLRQQKFHADSVYLDGSGILNSPTAWSVHALKAVALCCRRGTQIAISGIARDAWDALKQCGFILMQTSCGSINHNHTPLKGRYSPSWEPKKSATQRVFAVKQPSTAVVVGAGLAGAAVANSLARRGWQVVVLDAASAPATGASGLPAGLLVPHVSSDDSVLSRLSRSGVRMTLQQAGVLLEHGVDWRHCGVLTHDISDESGTRKALGHLATEAAEWHCAATPKQLEDAGLAATCKALWHAAAGWVKPAYLVRAWLDVPGIRWLGNARVAGLLPGLHGWQVMNETGTVLAQAHLVVLAAAHSSQALAATVNPVPWVLQAVRGQLTWGIDKGRLQSEHHGKNLPDFPVNGQGGLIPAVPSQDGQRWIMGASYERDCDALAVRPQDHDQNLARLRRLLPQAAEVLADKFNPETAQAWVGIRCATPNRLPANGCIATSRTGAEVWVCSGMGSRGLTFAVLCAELLAAQLHGEPLPLEQRLAQALMAGLPAVAHSFNA